MPEVTAESFDQTVERVVSMPANAEVAAKARARGFSIINVMWEDTARTPGSCWGANITDMTLQVRVPGARGEEGFETKLLPVIRKPNFQDVTCDLPFDKVKVRVGNEKSGGELQVIPLRDYIGNLASYVSDPKTVHPKNGSLLDESDNHILVSAQACFLPIPANSEATCSFNPVLYNYQSRQDNPAVLTILVTPEGTSATVLDNTNDKAQWGQNVYFNSNGEKSCLTGQRASAFKEAQAKAIAAQQGISVEEARSQVTLPADMNVVMVIQVPLKHKEPKYRSSPGILFFCSSMSDPDTSTEACAFGSSDVEDAVIGHGESEGKHFELGGYKLERDVRFPIRLTLQFYKATSNGVVTDSDLDGLQKTIEAVYKDADFVGSLVMNTLEKGQLGRGQTRPTAPSPLATAVISPPVDHPQVVKPFDPGQNPTAG